MKISQSLKKDLADRALWQISARVQHNR